MATGTAGSVARHYQKSLTHYLRKAIAYTDEDVSITVGVVPAGSIIIEVGVIVTEVFNDGTAGTIDIGVTGTAAALADDLDVLTSVGRIVDATTIASSASTYVSSDTTITAIYEGTDSDATTGAGIVYVLYMPANG